MRTENILMSLVALVVAALLVATGACSILLNRIDPNLLHSLFDRFADHANVFGCLALVFGLGLFALCVSICRGSYLSFQMGGNLLSSKTISQLTQKCLARTFEAKEVPCEVVVRFNKKIEIFADLPPIDMESREKQLCEIEETLAAMLANQCGFHRPFLFHARFKDE